MVTFFVAALLSQAPVVAELTDDQRKEMVAAASREQLEQTMQHTPVRDLIQMGQRAVSGLGVYSYRMHKQERVKGELLPVQEIVTTVREAPFAVRLEFVGGPGKGRRVLYNPGVRKDDFRVREAGVLKILGGLWIGVDSSLAKKDSNHTIREAGMGNLLARFMGDFDKAAPIGGFAVKHEGWNEKGHYCSMWIAPNKGVGFDNARSRICTDLKTGIPSKVESFNIEDQLTEKYEFSDVSKQTLSDEFFRPSGAGL